MSKTKSDILVTGGTGLVGAHLLFHLAQKEEQIIALKRETSSTELTEKIFKWYTNKEDKNTFDKIKWIDGDITDIASLEHAFQNIKQVYHTAGLVSFAPQDKEALMETNTRGTENIVNTALASGVEKLCYVSSVSAIGRDSNEATVHEEIPWDNNAEISWYARSKHEAEREVWRGMAEGLNAVIVNPSIILGPGKWNTGSAKMFETVYKGLNYYTSGTNGYVDVNDLAKIMIQLMHSGISEERFLINGENLSYQNLFTKMAEALRVEPPSKKAGKWASEMVWRLLKIKSIITGKKPLITKETARTANSTYHYSNEKIKRATGYRFRPISETIEYTATLFLDDIKQGN